VANGIPIVEDAAHSLGAEYNGRKVGSLQAYTTLSFHPVKHITTGEGGAILTDDADAAKYMRSFRHHGIDLNFRDRDKQHSWRYDIVTLGYNYRLPDINCALGISQLSKSTDWLARRQRLADLYGEALGDSPMLDIPREQRGCRSAWHLYVVRLHLERWSVSREEIFAALRAENIGVNVHYIPIPWLSLYAGMGYKRGQWPVAEGEYERMLTLPLYPGMCDQDVADVVEALGKIWTAYKR
jgi:dTDP-4-amino-4,6-dideoxygalactose transaminase